MWPKPPTIGGLVYRTTAICFLERAGLRFRQAERIYQKCTGCNRLSLCIAWLAVVVRREVRQSVEQLRVPADFAVQPIEPTRSGSPWWCKGCPVFRQTFRLDNDSPDLFEVLTGDTIGTSCFGRELKPGLEFTEIFCFSFGKVGQKFTSPNIFKLFQIILATNES